MCCLTTRTEEQTKTAIDWLEWHLFHERHGLGPSEFFLFVHYMDPHKTHDAPPSFREPIHGGL